MLPLYNKKHSYEINICFFKAYQWHPGVDDPEEYEIIFHTLSYPLNFSFINIIAFLGFA
jgi:hypothetical protein